jgi:hypothetical protein
MELQKRHRRITHRVKSDMVRIEYGRPTPDLLRERDERKNALERRTASQTLLGDPAPGYSALDLRGRG